MDDAWPEGDWYWDHEEFDDNPVPTETYDTYDLGNIYFHGDGEDPTNGCGYDLASLIRRWRKTRNYTPMTFLVKKGSEDEVKSLVRKFLK